MVSELRIVGEAPVISASVPLGAGIFGMRRTLLGYGLLSMIMDCGKGDISKQRSGMLA